MKIISYGIQLVIIGFLLFGVVWGAYLYFQFTWLKAFTFLFGVLAVFNVYFFRDPHRIVPTDPRKIISPADGKVVVIEETEEPEYFKEKAIKISIFLSVFNVHVNRNPISGTVEYLNYKKGEFLAAFNHMASEKNEQMAIGIKGENGKVLFKQIAGLIARRIVCELKTDDQVTQGERMGMIKYGSRVDVFMPVGTKITVKKGDIVKGGLTILGEFNG